MEPLKDRIIDQGQVYDAHEYLIRLFNITKKSIVIIDPYFDMSGLNYLKTLDKNIVKTVILSSKSTINEVDISLFNEQYGPLNIVKTNNFHDRYLLIDKETINVIEEFIFIFDNFVFNCSIFAHNFPLSFF